MILVHVLRRPVPEADPSVSDASEESEDESSAVLELDPLGCRFDFLIPLSIQHLVISAVAVSSGSSPTSLQLYTVQKHAVQVFHLTDLQYSSVRS